MMVAYNKKLIDMRNDAQHVLTLNFPNSKYAKAANLEDKAWPRFW